MEFCANDRSTPFIYYGEGVTTQILSGENPTPFISCNSTPFTPGRRCLHLSDRSTPFAQSRTTSSWQRDHLPCLSLNERLTPFTWQETTPFTLHPAHLHCSKYDSCSLIYCGTCIWRYNLP